MKQLPGSVAVICFLWLFSFSTDPENSIAGKENDKRVNQQQEKLFYPSIVNDFYLLNNGSLFWYANDSFSPGLRNELVSLIDSAGFYKMISTPYHLPKLKKNKDERPEDSVTMRAMDKIYTDAAIALMMDLYRGYKTKAWFQDDPVAEKQAETDNQYILQLLLEIHSAKSLREIIEKLEPHDPFYFSLRNELRRQVARKNKDTVAYLATSLNYYKWIHHFRFSKYIVVNIPSCRLSYFEGRRMLLSMKVVVGKSSTPTPRFSAWCDQAILYPYWYVPRSIIFKEFLPLIKRNPSWLDTHNMQVVDGAGKILNHHALNWSSYHTGYFPYLIRQSTGCDNSLGVIKFNINTPFGVYLHDTNNKNAFLSASRFYSHGCIRIQKPLELGNYLLDHKLDTSFLQSCFKEQKPIVQLLAEPVPVFSIYSPVEMNESGKLIYYRDVYKLLK